MVKSILVLVGLALAGLLVFAATRPDRFSLQRSITVNAPPAKIHPLINDLRQFNTWNPYEKKDPQIKGSYRGPAAGPGARYEFQGNQDVGAGSLEIIDSRAPASVALRLDMTAPMTASNIITFTLRPYGQGTEVTWAMEGASPFLAKLIGIFIDMDQGLFALISQVRTGRKRRQSRRTTKPRLAVWARSATTSGAVCAPFPAGCGQKGHAGCCADLPGATPAASTRLPHGLFDPQRILRNEYEQALQIGRDFEAGLANLKARAEQA